MSQNQTPNADPFGSKKQQDAVFEEQLKMGETDPAAYAKLSANQKMALGYYAERKQKESANNE